MTRYIDSIPSHISWLAAGLRIVRLASLLGFLSFFVGCGDAESEPIPGEVQDGLINGAQNALSDAVEDGFGDGDRIVVWQRFDQGRLPDADPDTESAIEFGGFFGEVLNTVAADSGNDQTVQLKVRFDLRSAPESLSDAPIVWMDGNNRGESARVTEYDPTTRTISLAGVDPSAVPESGTRFVIDPGRKLRFGQSVYMTQCMHCHGVLGDGQGPTAKYLNPRPRDYTTGTFKFKTTEGQEKPSRTDLRRVLKQGVPGTYMPSFMMLPEDELAAVVEYVRFLAIRGEFEDKAAIGLADGFSQEAYASTIESLREQLQQYQKDLAEWNSAGSNPDDKPDEPGFVSAEAEAARQFQAFLKNSDDGFPVIVDEASTDLADFWVASESSDTVVKPTVSRTATIDEVAAWLVDTEQPKSVGKVQSVPDTASIESIEVQLPDSTSTKSFEKAGGTLVWLTGAQRGVEVPFASYSIESGQLSFATPIEVADDDSNRPRPDDRFLVASEVLPAASYVIREGAPSELFDWLNASSDTSSKESSLRAQLHELSLQRGRRLYLSATAKCATCHGDTGRGDGPETESYKEYDDSVTGTKKKYSEPGLYDDWHQKIKPRDLTRGIYRGGRRPYDVFCRISEGIRGTPMPGFRAALKTDMAVWDVVNFVLYLPHQNDSENRQRQRSSHDVALKQSR